MPLDGSSFVHDDALGRIDRVIDLLATEDRWCKGIAETPGGRRCIIGAIRAAEAHLVLEPLVLHAIREVSGRRYWRIESFNDAKTTTHAQVLAVLQRTRADIAAGRVAAPAMRRGIGGWWRSLTGSCATPEA